MFVCGIEEPLAPNPMIHALDEASDEIGECGFGNPSLNRYSFIWFGDYREGPARIVSLLQECAEQINLAPSLLLVGQVPGDGSTPAGRLFGERADRLLQLGSEGWNVDRLEELFVITKGIDPAELVSISPWEQPPGMRHGLSVWLGELPEPAEFLKPPLENTTRRTARLGRPAPSRQFMAWLALGPRAICYRETDDLGRVAAVYVGTFRIDLDSLPAAALIRERFTGDDAWLAWRYGPSGIRPTG